MQSPKLSAGNRDTQAIFSFVQRLQNVMRENPNANVIILWDGKSWRKDIYTEYKANRGKTEKEQQARADYYVQKEQIMEAVSLLGIRQMWGTNMEADDLAAMLSKKLTGSNMRTTLMTADQDWQQLVSPNCEWIDIIHHKHCTHENFSDVAKFRDTKQFVEAKCILGDAGDNIKGIKGIGPKTLETLYTLGHWDSFGSFLFTVAAPHGKGWAAKYWHDNTGKNMPKVLRELDVDEAWDKLNENLKLVDLETSARPQVAKMIDNKGRLDIEAFQEFCHKNAFHTITRRMEDFIESFKNNKYVTK